eukprot:13946126-Ditylum_brightwellii.AAC.1
MASAVVLVAVAMASLALAKEGMDQLEAAKKAARKMAKDMDKDGKAGKDEMPTIEGDDSWGLWQLWGHALLYLIDVMLMEEYRFRVH